MKWSIWLIGLTVVLVVGLLVFSLVSGLHGPVPSGSAARQAKQLQSALDQADPFSEEARSAACMIEGTVDY